MVLTFAVAADEEYDGDKSDSATKQIRKKALIRCLKLEQFSFTSFDKFDDFEKPRILFIHYGVIVSVLGTLVCFLSIFLVLFCSEAWLVFRELRYK